MVGGLAIGAAGCFGSDPNKNSSLYGQGGVSGGGSGGSGGASVNPTDIVGTALATFDTADTGVSGFALDDYADTAQTNLNAPTSTSKPTLMFDAGDGSPNPGALKIMAPYSGASQYVDIQRQLGLANLQDWTGGTMHVRIKVDAGSTFGGGVQLYVKTTSTFVFGGTFINLGKNSNWQEFTLSVDAPMTKNSGYDATKVISYGLQLNTGSAGSAATPVTFHVDSFSLQGGHLPVSDADAGSDGVASDATAPADAAGN
jgi:hypothetical protein